MSASTIPLAHGQHGRLGVALSRHGRHAGADRCRDRDLHYFRGRLYLLHRQEPHRAHPRQVLELPIFNTVCLLSSSFTIWIAERALKRGAMGAFSLWWALTVVLGAIFLVGTGLEWKKLIYHDGLTISTNLFGTTFYSLVGLHASHVIIGLTMLSIVLIFSLTGKLKSEHSRQLEVLSLYWHFVDGVWVVVFTVVYIIGR